MSEVLGRYGVEWHPERKPHVLPMAAIMARNKGRVLAGEPVRYVVVESFNDLEQAKAFALAFRKMLEGEE